MRREGHEERGKIPGITVWERHVESRRPESGACVCVCVCDMYCFKYSYNTFLLSSYHLLNPVLETAWGVGATVEKKKKTLTRKHCDLRKKNLLWHPRYHVLCVFPGTALHSAQFLPKQLYFCQGERKASPWAPALAPRTLLRVCSLLPSALWEPLPGLSPHPILRHRQCSFAVCSLV